DKMVDGGIDQSQPFRHARRRASIHEVDPCLQGNRLFLFPVPRSRNRRGRLVFCCNRHWPTNLARTSGRSRTILPDSSHPDPRPRWSLHHLRRTRWNSLLWGTANHSVSLIHVIRGSDSSSGSIVRSYPHSFPIRSLDWNRGFGSFLRERIAKRRDVLGLRTSTPGVHGHNQHSVLSSSDDRAISSRPGRYNC